MIVVVVPAAQQAAANTAAATITPGANAFAQPLYTGGQATPSSYWCGWQTANLATVQAAFAGVTGAVVYSAEPADVLTTTGLAAAPGDANSATMRANIQTHIGQLETWLTANPNGAVLTAAQTKFLAQTLIGVGRLMLGLTDKVGGAT